MRLAVSSSSVREVWSDRRGLCLSCDLRCISCSNCLKALCLFAPFLARFVHHSTIKFYLSGVRALYIEQGLPHPVQNCLHLQRVVRGIKRSQGFSSSNRLLITDNHILLIWKSLNLHLPDNCMFWAACTLGYFDFLRALSLQCLIWPASLLQFTWLCRIFQWMEPFHLLVCVSPSKRQRLTLFVRGLTCILA